MLREEKDRFERADGTVQWIRWEIRPWYQNEKVAGIAMFTEELTEDEKRAEALRYSEARFRILFQITLGDKGVHDPMCRRTADPCSHRDFCDARGFIGSRDRLENGECLAEGFDRVVVFDMRLGKMSRHTAPLSRPYVHNVDATTMIVSICTNAVKRFRYVDSDLRP